MSPKSALEKLLAAASKGEHVIAEGCRQCNAQRDLAALAHDMAQELIDRRSAGQALAEAVLAALCVLPHELNCPLRGAAVLDTPLESCTCVRAGLNRDRDRWNALGEAKEGRDG